MKYNSGLQVGYYICITCRFQFACDPSSSYRYCKSTR